MCGICGWYNKKREIDKNVLGKMNNAVKHRGPDDEGYVLINDNGLHPYTGGDSIALSYPNIDEKGDDGFFLGFGHRRLSIIDLSSQGHQPMISEDSGLCVTFNGEIYNYVELKHELKMKGHKFFSNSDTEVLLKSYMEWGENCVSHFNGMWSFAIFDQKTKVIFCSRDRLGAKPFYYYVDDDNFIFSSEIKQLIQNPLVPKYINEELLTTHVMWSISDFSDSTLIKDIKSLRGGNNLKIELATEKTIKDSINIYQYWEISTRIEKSEKAVEEVFNYHDNSVKIRTRSDVPIGILLSGGLDSSTLVAEISDYYRAIGRNPKEINSFTSCYKDYSAGDERKYAELVNNYCGVTQNLVYPDTDSSYEVFESMIWHTEGLCSFYSMGSFLTVKHIAEKGIKVIINGQGADETMFGYERYYTWYLLDCLHRSGIVSFLREYKRITVNSQLTPIRLLKYILYFNNISIRRARCKKRMKKYITHRMLEHFNNNRSVEKYLKFDDLASMQYNEIRGTQLTHILRGDDRSFMAFSIESRVPFIDYKYIEEAVKVPEQLKIQDGYTKYLLRKHIEGRLPDEIVWRKNKMGWPSPANKWIEKLDKNKVEMLFVNPRCGKLFNVSAIRELWTKNPGAYAVEKFMSVEIFMRLFDLTIE